jgi:hypothetical protein
MDAELPRGFRYVEWGLAAGLSAVILAMYVRQLSRDEEMRMWANRAKAWLHRKHEECPPCQRRAEMMRRAYNRAVWDRMRIVDGRPDDTIGPSTP